MKKEYRNLKKFIGISCMVIVVLVIFTGIKINSDPLFLDKIRTSILTDEYFTKIEKDGVVDKDREKEDSTWKYKYDIQAYNKDGKAIKVSFYAEKNLRKGAYLKLNVQGGKDKNGVYSISSYEEVNETSLPSVVKEKL
ncbi:YxeA family protein [Paraclostridium sordellii]|uniref:YxeA family protein n=1 Tax=Paraclostridium sordellii TaxID=1505 RepID=UPI0005E1F447|nr:MULTISPECIES: YxeA family protein [Paeniclostridium]MBW4863875.1 YxeA family protein [Paeniclostridium sp.]MDU6115991.1 YxeA family protein [Paeniclostridium sordellii]CEN83573.1 Uncharacterized protein conserved in bacteria [[Clostridium] sordellii] [Paeniclostridium sordellii]